MKDSYSKNSTLFEQFLRSKLVGAEDTTLYNIIYDKHFTATIYNRYLEAFRSGLQLNSLYTYSDTCISGFQAFMDSLFWLNKNGSEVNDNMYSNWS